MPPARLCRLGFILGLLFANIRVANCQAVLAPAPAGFDQHHKGVSVGKTHKVTYTSTAVGVKRKVDIYTPPGYSVKAKYPVLYLMHGLGGDQNDWATVGRAANILDNLQSHQKIVPMIVVMPDNRSSANKPPPANKDEERQQYRQFDVELFDDVIPFVESHYSVIRGRRARALVGLSMGGAQAINFGLTHLDTFAWVGAFSAGHDIKPLGELIPDPAATSKQLGLFWLSCGAADSGQLAHNKKLHDDLVKLKVPHLWHLDTGGHEWPVWKNDLYLLSQLLFR